MTEPVAPAAAPDGPSAGAAAVIAFLAGAGVLALEITGARVFTPWFGSSILVWTNVIGVTLGAVAIGNFLGGRLADRAIGYRLSGLLVGAALLTAALPYETSWLARRYLPEGLPLDLAFALIDRASLLVAICALGPPLVLLGAVTPFLVRAAASSTSVGRAAGTISAAATAGSLVGTWLPVHYLVPEFGSRATCLVAAGALIAAAFVAAPRDSGGWTPGRVVRLMSPWVLLMLALLGDRSVGRAGTDRVIAEVESRYQYARVEEDDDYVTLRLNEGLDSFHSLTSKHGILTDRYFDCYSLFVPLAAREGRVDVLILGFAAGTIGRQILDLYGESLDVRVVGVELDPAVAALGPRYFGLPQDERIEVIADQDARTYLYCTEREFDYIVVDTYASQVYVPFQMCSREFFELARERLRRGGVLAANLSGYTPQDAPLVAIRNTATAVFERALFLPVPGSRNFVLAVRRDGPVPDPRDAAVPDALVDLREAIRRGRVVSYGHDSELPILTDDHSPIEKLYDRELLARARAQLRPDAPR